MTDFDLLRSYVSSGSEDQFAVLVGRYASLVYSAALRQSRNPHDAEEITQAVFIILARKAGAMNEQTVFAGWLLRTTRLVALAVLRKESRRRRAEQEAMSLQLTETDSAWQQIAPALDEALLRLSNRDRDAVVLRFFEHKSFKEIAKVLGTSDDNAQKRVSRALRKLQALCLKRGVKVTATVFVAAVTASAVKAAPSSLTSAVVTAVTSGAAAAEGVAQSGLAALQRARLRSLGLKSLTAALVLVVAFFILYLARLSWSGRRTGGPGIVRTEELSPPQTPAPPALEATGPVEPRPGKLRLRVLDGQTGAPLAKARITSIASNWGIAGSPGEEAATDLQGESVVSYDLKPPDDWGLVIEVIRDGYIPQFVGWSAPRGDLLEGLPAEYTVRLARGEIIGGVVLNESGEPVSDARVSVGGPGPKLVPDGPPEREGVAMAHDEVTDNQGRWMCNHTPPLLEVLDFTVVHPDYIGVRAGVARFQDTPSSGTARLPEQELRSQTAVVTLKRGLVVSGMVVDEAGNPVVGAKVTRDPVWYDSPSQITGADGTFRFGNVSGEDLTLTVVAGGFVAKQLKIHPAANAATVRFELARAAVLRGQVVDEGGKPIPKASVLTAGGDLENDWAEWSALTDERGKFQWLSVPPSHKLYQVHADGFRSLTNLELVADGEEHLVALHAGPKIRRARIRGTAVDAETRQLVDAFEVWVSTRIPYGPSGALLSTGPELRTAAKDGQFSFLTSKSSAGLAEDYSIEIRATGYWAAKLSVPGQLTNGYQVDFALSPAPRLTGLVQLPDGQPAAGAVVLLCAKPEQTIRLIRPAQFDLAGFRGQRTQTDTNGAFTIGLPSGKGTVLIAHDAGYAEIPIPQKSGSHLFQLEPWGGIAGVLMIGSQPGSNETVCLQSPRHAPFLANFGTMTEADGHFTVGRLPPGGWRISHELNRGGHQIRPPLTQTMTIHVTAGEMSQITLGGIGRAVIGRIRLDGPGQRLDWKVCLVSLTAAVQGSPVPGRDSCQYQGVLEPDGSFVVNDVIPGVYKLRIESRPVGVRELRDLVAVNPRDSMTWDILVPESSGSHAAPCNLGFLEIGSNKP